MPATDEDIVRDLLHRCTADVYPAASVATGVIARQRRRDLRRRAVSAVAAGAALGTAAGFIALVPGRGTGSGGAGALGTGPAGTRSGGTSTGGATATARPALTLTASQRVLYQLSSAAARQQPPQGRYAVLSEKESGNLDTSVIDSLTGDMWSYQKGFNGAPSGAGKRQPHWSPTAAQFAAMPLDPAALRKSLIAYFDQQWREQLGPLSQYPGYQPGEKLTPPGTPDDQAVQQAMNFLWNPLTPPALRGALFRVLADTPGVRVDASARDLAGRPAVKTSWTGSDKTVYSAYEDPATGAVLELGFNWPASVEIPTFGYDLMRSITHVDAIPPDPYSG